MMRRDVLTLLAIAALLIAWLAARTVDRAPPDGALDTGALLNDAPESFRRVTGPRALRFPADHAAHPGFRNEWWYFTGNLDDAGGRAWGFQFTLFRFELDAGERADSAWAADAVWMAHLALSDVDGEVFHSAERFARGALGLAGASDERWWLRDWQVTRSGESFRLEALAEDFGLSLGLEPRRPIVLQGDRGYSRKGPGEGNASHYYSITRLDAEGSLHVDGRERTVSGRAWLDREWGSSQLAESLDGWDWFSLQLEDGRDVMVYRLREDDGGASRFSAGKIVYPDDSSRTLAADDFTARPRRRWRDGRGVTWPVAWTVGIPSENLLMDVEARFENQRWTGAVSYWEGAVVVRDAESGEALGRGYLELSGYGD